ncbi:hypothetical protein PanWU01x14_116520 [Parasponia andersonii]|uniref:Uncharacterized protein n=1 Tax=Parasponia andersonii TaxID=3476 RepID=A0A2P5CWR9_PARAD|nr:hypothetical protein PanWU01x14_116520 [Parasponia andersonii]
MTPSLQYNGEDEVTSGWNESAEESSSNSGNILLSGQNTWPLNNTTSKFIARKIESKVKWNQLIEFIDLYSWKKTKLYRYKPLCRANFPSHTCCTYSDQILKASGMLLLIIYFGLDFDGPVPEEIGYLYKLKSSPGLVDSYHLAAQSKPGYNIIKQYKSDVVLARVKRDSSLGTEERSAKKFITEKYLVASRLWVKGVKFPRCPKGRVAKVTLRNLVNPEGAEMMLKQPKIKNGKSLGTEILEASTQPMSRTPTTSITPNQPLVGFSSQVASGTQVNEHIKRKSKGIVVDEPYRRITGSKTLKA